MMDEDEKVTVSKTLLEHRRAMLLSMLAQLPPTGTNTTVLHDVCVRLGVPSTYDQIRSALSWLQEQGYVDQIGDTGLIFVATSRGEAIASGASVVPGVARNKPSI